MSILLVVESEERSGIYRESLRLLTADVRIVASLQEAAFIASQKPHNGILVDMPIMIRVSQAIKDSVDYLMECLPCAFINISGKNHELRILSRSSAALQATTLEDFVTVCGRYSPRIIFPRVREPVCINALLDLTPEFPSPERTACIDISFGGCFLFTVRSDISIGATVWIKLTGLSSAEPIQGTVLWQREWGRDYFMPGIGVHFENASHSLKAEIAEILTRYREVK